LFGKQAAATGAACYIWLIAIGVTGVYLPVAAVTAFVTHPRLTGLSWLFLAGTGVLHTGYFLFLQLGYRLGDLSVGYPIGPGTGAMLAALAGVSLLGERPSLIGGAGILAIVGGVVVIGVPQRPAVQADPAAAVFRRHRLPLLPEMAALGVPFSRSICARRKIRASWSPILFGLPQQFGLFCRVPSLRLSQPALRPAARFRPLLPGQFRARRSNEPSSIGSAKTSG
jgi:multidrug transporter EmrE-like cation transporter